MLTADLLTLRAPTLDAAEDAVNEHAPFIADANAASLHTGRRGDALVIADHWEHTWYVVDREPDGAYDVGAAFRYFGLDHFAADIDREITRAAA